MLALENTTIYQLAIEHTREHHSRIDTPLLTSALRQQTPLNCLLFDELQYLEPHMEI